MSELERAAIAYARHGRRIFPLAPGSKVPAIKGGRGVLDATCDESKVRAWWSAHPQSNIGLAVLPHEVVVDVDVRSGGDQTLLAWLSEGPLPTTPTQVTPTTGAHHFFARPAGFELVAKPGAGIDVLGTGKYVVAAPSRIVERPDPYRWTTRLSTTPLAAPPDWLARRILRAPAPSPSPRPDLPRPRADVLTRAERYLQTCDPAIQGSGGSNTTFRVAVRITRGFALDEDTAVDLLERIYNPRCDPPWTRRELRHKVKQAIAKGNCDWGALL